ncbi:MAG: hypothetical protein WAQ98_06315 [Blastocatellia bacterium]
MALFPGINKFSGTKALTPASIGWTLTDKLMPDLKLAIDCVLIVKLLVSPAIIVCCAGVTSNPKLA